GGRNGARNGNLAGRNIVAGESKARGSAGIDRQHGGLSEPLRIALALCRGAVDERGDFPRNKFTVAAENRGKNTDKMVWVSREGKNEGLEVSETRGCRGAILSRLNPSVTIALRA